MKRSFPFLLLLAGCRLSCSADASRSAPDELFAGLESPFVLRSSDGRTRLGVMIRPRDAARRAPVALALVIDNSGSMYGEKIEFARSASRAIVDALADGDEVSLTQFSDSAQNLVPLTRVDGRARDQLRAAIAKIEPASGTAILDGMQTGLRTLAAAQSPSRRLILISDGQANVGPSTPHDLLAALPPPSVTLSTIGVGTDYDENVMTAIAQYGSGGFHHLNDPVQLRGILEDELKQAHAVTGTNALVEIACPPGVRILDAEGVALERRDGKVRVRVGDLYAGGQRIVLLPIQVPVDGASGLVGSVRLSYQPIDRRRQRVSEVEVRYQLTSSAVEVARGTVPELEVVADRTRVARALDEVLPLIKKGDLIEAQTLLRDERTRLEARADKLTGPARAEALELVALLRDPYIDASPVTNPPAGPDRFAALMQAAQLGQPLGEAEVAQLDGAQLRLLRNMPFARHGYPFKSADLDAHFSKLSWYHADPRFDDARLSRVDADNIALAHSYEGRAALFPARAKAEKPLQLDALLARARKGEALSAADLDALDLAQLRLVRNVSYARHGYVFRASDLQAIFGAKAWYHADPGYQESRLTANDHDNIAATTLRERTLLAGAGEALRDFELRSRAHAWDALHRK